MTDAEMLRGLREDIRDLHGKIDKYTNDNHTAHMDLQKQLAGIDKKSGINATKIGIFVTAVTIFVAGAVNAAFHMISK